MNIFALSALALALVCVSACATAPRLPPEAASDAFVIERDLVGASVARGEFRAITGTRRGFTAYLNGVWDGQTLTLVEDFVFDDGERDRKTWRLSRIGEGRYVGTREDVVGQARGYQDGAAFRLEYDVVLPSQNGKGRRVHFQDVMVRTGAGSILNRANVGWFGLRVAQVELTIERETAAIAAE
ncbi:MAG: DUF3833 family protein [Hyphomonadaceae bacterium]